MSPIFMFSGVYSCLRWAEFLQPVCTVCACVLLCVSRRSRGGIGLLTSSPHPRNVGRTVAVLLFWLSFARPVFSLFRAFA